jgi:hypothetical protein
MITWREVCTLFSCWTGHAVLRTRYVSLDVLLCVSPLLTSCYTRKRETSANHVQQPFYSHTRRSKTEEDGRGLETYHESRFEYVPVDLMIPCTHVG